MKRKNENKKALLNEALLLEEDLFTTSFQNHNKSSDLKDSSNVKDNNHYINTNDNKLLSCVWQDDEEQDNSMVIDLNSINRLKKLKVTKSKVSKKEYTNLLQKR